MSNSLHKSSPGSQINCKFLMSQSKLHDGEIDDTLLPGNSF
ncbi:hypothetical protein OIU79_011186 [Salix purpurea]|uniref:Uncharacterized protein n=1 Tax=Salix purpurea TaxID=77065 RepID=A0A9Q0QHC9_SALPP|nr:hypothetical protein OIU79_011186 [Salix purpurea]